MFDIPKVFQESKDATSSTAGMPKTADVGDVFTAIDVPWVSAVARVFLLMLLYLLLFMYLLLQGFPTFLTSLLFSVPGVVGVSAVANSPADVMFLLLLAIPALASNPAGVAVVPALPEVLKNQTYLTMTVKLVIFWYLIICRSIDIYESSYRTIILHRLLETQKKIIYALFLYFDRSRLPWSLNTTK